MFYNIILCFALCALRLALLLLRFTFFLCYIIPSSVKEGENFEKDFRGKNFKPVLVKGMGFFIFGLNGTD
jgi:hypothetical protein